MGGIAGCRIYPPPAFFRWWFSFEGLVVPTLLTRPASGIVHDIKGAKLAADGGPAQPVRRMLVPPDVQTAGPAHTDNRSRLAPITAPTPVIVKSDDDEVTTGDRHDAVMAASGKRLSSADKIDNDIPASEDP